MLNRKQPETSGNRCFRLLFFCIGIFGNSKMIYYLNRGFILEQALRDVVSKYFARLKLGDVYQNFHLSVTNEHPFARMISSENEITADIFPAIIISCENDEKPEEMQDLPIDVQGIALTESDIDVIAKPDSTIGHCVVTDKETLAMLKETARREGFIYGVSYRIRRRDKVSVEIWSENQQLKNEIYEQLRLLFCGSLSGFLFELYKEFDPSIDDKTVTGDRSNNYNFDFDVPLFGSNIVFDVDYCIEQILIDTEVKELNRDIILEVINHVKE